MDISIVLPIHGNGNFLPDTLKSIQSQTFKGTSESILILDRCTENVVSVISSFKLIPNMQVVHSDRPGLVSALNSGLKIASGKYIARIDSDDLMLPDRLQLQFEYLELNTDVIVLGTDVIEINEKGEEIGSRSYPKTAEGMRKALNYQCTIAHPSTLFRRQSILELGGYRPFFEHAEDYDLWVRAKRHGKIISLASAQTLYRVHPEQISNSQHKIRVFGSYTVRLNSILERFHKDNLIKRFGTFENWEKSHFGMLIMKYVTFRLSVNRRIADSINNSKNGVNEKSLLNLILRGLKKLKGLAGN